MAKLQDKLNRFFDWVCRPENTLLILKYGLIFSLLGRFWQFFRWDPKIRNLFWNKYIFQGPVELLGFSWSDYVTSKTLDSIFNGISDTLGLYFLVCIAAVFLIERYGKVAARILFIGSGIIAFWALLKVLDRLLVLQFFEYASHIMLPVVFVWFYRSREWSDRLQRWLKVSIAATFAGHGLFAVGYYPVPNYFIDMTIRGLFMSEPVARGFLQFAGIMDFAIAIGIFVRSMPRLQLFFAGYALLWGTMTTTARLYANFTSANIIGTFDRWFFEVLIRIPHVLFPLFLTALLWQAYRKRASESLVTE